VAGAAALVLAANPLLDAAAVAQTLKDSASGHGAWSPELGFGVIDAASAVQFASRAPRESAQAVRRLRWKLAKRQNLLRIRARWKGAR
jgi:hypothetical protein